MNRFGDLIRSKREENELLLRQLAAKLDIDTAYLSKMERGERVTRREQALRLIEVFELDYDSTLALWLADQVYNLVSNDKQAVHALELARDELTKHKINE